MAEMSEESWEYMDVLAHQDTSVLADEDAWSLGLRGFDNEQPEEQTSADINFTYPHFGEAIPPWGLHSTPSMEARDAHLSLKRLAPSRIGDYHPDVDSSTVADAVHIPAPQPVACKHPGCEYTAQTASQLRKHQISHTPYDLLPCSQCDLRFNDPRDLRRHLHTHEQGDRYYCVVAGCSSAVQGFRRRDHLFRHLRSTHNQAPKQAHDGSLASSVSWSADTPGTRPSVPHDELGTDNLAVDGDDLLEIPRGFGVPAVQSKEAEQDLVDADEKDLERASRSPSKSISVDASRAAPVHKDIVPVEDAKTNPEVMTAQTSDSKSPLSDAELVPAGSTWVRDPPFDLTTDSKGEVEGDEIEEEEFGGEEFESKEVQEDMVPRKRNTDRNNEANMIDRSSSTKIKREDLSVDTLSYYDIPYEHIPNDQDYILILRKLDKFETDVLLEHTKRLRSGELSLETLEKANNAWVRKEHNRKESPIACIRCRTRKIYCDRLQPCGRCRRAEVTCSRPVQDRKLHVSARYIRELEDKVKALDVLEKNREKTEEGNLEQKHLDRPDHMWATILNSIANDSEPWGGEMTTWGDDSDIALFEADFAKLTLDTKNDSVPSGPTMTDDLRNSLPKEIIDRTLDADRRTGTDHSPKAVPPNQLLEQKEKPLASSHDASVQFNDIQRQTTVTLALESLQSEHSSLLQNTTSTGQTVDDLSNRNEGLAEQIKSLKLQLISSERKREDEHAKADIEKDQLRRILKYASRVNSNLTQKLDQQLEFNDGKRETYRAEAAKGRDQAQRRQDIHLAKALQEKDDRLQRKVQLGRPDQSELDENMQKPKDGRDGLQAVMTLRKDVSPAFDGVEASESELGRSEYDRETDTDQSHIAASNKLEKYVMAYLPATQRMQTLCSLILRCFRPKCRPELSRIEWSCSCGKAMYGDYTMPKSGISEFVRALPNGRIDVKRNPLRPSAKRDLGLFMFWVSKAVVVLTGVCIVIIVGVGPVIYTYMAALLASLGAVRHLGSQTTPTSTMVADGTHSIPLQAIGGGSSSTAQPYSQSMNGEPIITTSQGDPSDPMSADVGQPPQTNPTAPASNAVYFELCVSRGNHQVSLCEIQLTDVQGTKQIKTDIALFAQIRKRYDAFRRRSLRRLLYLPQDIHFVQFGVLRAGVQTGIYDKPLAIPPAVEVTEKRYHYHECPLHPLPPIDSRTFFHYFWEHGNHPPAGANSIFESLFMSRLPKKLGDSIFNQREPRLQLGWGVHIIEGPNKPLLAWLATAILVLSFAVSLSYDIGYKNKESGFAIGQWMVAVLGTMLMALYFHLADVA